MNYKETYNRLLLADSAPKLKSSEPLRFVQRVHRSQNRPKLSYHIQRCCDYIEMNLDKKILAKDLASLVGYTEYYLSQRFRDETGLFINDYIKQVKIDRARLLLISTDLSIQKISEQLGFNTRSYFTQVFREMVGITPVAYRERHRR